MLVSELTLPALFVAGMGSSVHCALMCGAIGAWPLDNRGSIPRNQALILIHGGRLIGYAALGALSGGLGSQLILRLPDQRWGQDLQLAAALALLITGLIQLRSATASPRLAASCCTTEPSWPGKAPRHLQLFSRGLMWSAMPCGILYGMLALASLSGSAWAGASVLGAFALGTIPILSAGNMTFSALGHFRGAKSLRYMAAALLIGLGVSSLIVILIHGGPVLAVCRTAA